MSIAWASEYLYDMGPLTLFATHYHELSNLADVKPGVTNSNVAHKGGDGMSIAWAVSEYLYDMGPLTLFATHYHELSNLADVKPGVTNSNVVFFPYELPP